jgi:hypothetical protein
MLIIYFINKGVIIAGLALFSPIIGTVLSIVLPLILTSVNGSSG